MPTSTRFAVAIHTLAAIAVTDGKPLRSEALAFSASTNPTVIRALLSRLADAGLTTSQLGAGGGALLAKPAKGISLLDVYLAVEEPELFAMHRSAPNATCPVGRNITAAIRGPLDRARLALENQLAAVTIDDVAHEIARLAKVALPVPC
jgi:Rrf2 family protein